MKTALLNLLTQAKKLIYTGLDLANHKDSEIYAQLNTIAIEIEQLEKTIRAESSKEIDPPRSDLIKQCVNCKSLFTINEFLPIDPQLYGMNVEDREELLSHINEPFPLLSEKEARPFIHQNPKYDHTMLNICTVCFEKAKNRSKYPRNLHVVTPLAKQLNEDLEEFIEFVVDEIKGEITLISILKEFMNGCEENSMKGLVYLSESPELLNQFTDKEVHDYVKFTAKHYVILSEDIELIDALIRDNEDKLKIIQAYLIADKKNRGY